MELNTKGVTPSWPWPISPSMAPSGAVPLSAIAERQHISLAYLEQIFLRLRRAGLVESARGRSGGYRLARPADEINVAEIMAAVEEDTRMTRCGGEAAALHRRAALPDARAVGRAGEHIVAFLADVTLQEVLDGIPGREQAAAAARGNRSPALEFGGE